MIQLTKLLTRLTLCSALSAGGLCAAVGCHGHTDPMAADADPSKMSKDDLMARGEQLIRRGEAMKDDATKMAPADTRNGMSRDDIMGQADEMIKEGQTLRDRALKM